MRINKDNLARRFLQYARIDTASDPASATCPSTTGQIELAKVLIVDLLEVGCSEVHLDENGYVTATLPANSGARLPVIGLIAHLDTSPDFSGKEVNPRIIENYQGGDIPLDPDGKVVLSPADFPELDRYTGQDLIVTDGSTLLGADDKAGIAAIIAAVEYLNDHPEIRHGRVRVCFTPDEEIGRGADRFDVNGFGADFAYTVDGGGIGELEYENFNAASASVRFHGRNVHPGTAKAKMINALQLAIDFHGQLPEGDRPERTEGYEGFFHLTRLDGTVEKARLEYIIRDHDAGRFALRKEMLRQIASRFNTAYPPGTVELAIKDQYFNMKEKIEPVMHIVERAAGAMRMAGIEPLITPIRGGTDGARLSYMGLPTPNLFTGGHNFHGRYEFLPIQSLAKSAEVIVNLLTIGASSLGKQS
ncbi:MAG: peptidase T [Bacteroidales bacterium]